MSVLIETTMGNICIDLNYKQPQHELACFHFIQLCKADAYFFQPFHGLIKDSQVLLGDNDTNLLKSPNNIPYDVPNKYNDSKTASDIDEKEARTSSLQVGSVAFTSNQIQSETGINPELAIILGKDNESTLSLVPFGKISEGFATLELINDANTNKEGNYSPDIRVRATHILHDPFPEHPVVARTRHLSDSQLENANLPIKKFSESITNSMEKPTNAEINTLTLEMLGDIPIRDFTPSPRTLFVAKLNPVTEEDLLQIVFGRFGTVIGAKIVRDEKKQSLCYGFVEFSSKQEAENAYFSLSKGCVLDGRQIAIDFSQSSFKRRN